MTKKKLYSVVEENGRTYYVSNFSRFKTPHLNRMNNHIRKHSAAVRDFQGGAKSDKKPAAKAVEKDA